MIGKCLSNVRYFLLQHRSIHNLLETRKQLTCHGPFTQENRHLEIVEILFTMF